MDLLPDEVLLMIFEYLPMNYTTGTCKRVCKRWSKLVERRSLIIEGLNDTTRLHSGVRSLLVRGWLASLRTLVYGAAYYSPYLRSLSVHAGMPFTNEHIVALRHLHNLEHLDVFARSQVHDLHFAPVVKRLESVVFNENVAPDLLKALKSGCQLTEIHMYGRAVHYHTRHLRTVLHLRAEYIRDLTLRCTELNDKAYETIGNCPNLVSLRLYSCWLMTGKGVMHVIRPPLLHCLHVTGATLVRSSALRQWLEVLPASLQELVLSSSWFGDEHVPILVERKAPLHTLELWKCELTPMGAVALALALPTLKTYDLDLKLSQNEIEMLKSHPSLETLRCLKQIDQSKEGTNKKYKLRRKQRRKICIISSDARFPRKYFRGGGEGFRSSLFYFWTQGKELVPLPDGIRPSLDDEDDMFY